MTTTQNLTDKVMSTVKSMSTLVMGSISLIAAIGGSIIYVENNYAHADDTKQIIQNQTQQLKQFDQSQRSLGLFQLEYYDDKLKRLYIEKQQSESQPKRAQQRGQVRSPEQIQDEIKDVKQRKELITRSITQ